MPLSLSLCLLQVTLLSLAHYCRAGTLPPFVLTGELDLDRSAATIEATAECGLDAAGTPGIPMEFCAANDVCEICMGGSYPALAAIDGDASTSWVSRPGDSKTVNVTLQLGQPFHLSGLTITSGPSPLPASWTIHIAENGSSFTPLVSFYSDDQTECLGLGSGEIPVIMMGDILGEDIDVQCEMAPEGYEVPIHLDDNTFGDEGFPLVTGIRLELKTPRAADDPTDLRQLYFSLSELVVVGHCPLSAEDCPIIVEPGCGFCVAQVIDALRAVHELIVTALEQVPRLEIEPGTIENLEDAIERLKMEVGHLDGTFLTLTVVYGSTSPLSLDIDLQSSVVRLDLQLVPSILEKLEIIRTELMKLPEFTFNTSHATDLLDSLQEPLTSTIANATELHRLVEVLLSRADSLRTNVTLALNSTRQSRLNANESLTTILSRDFTEIFEDLNVLASDASRFLMLAQYLLEKASENHMSSEEVRGRADEVEPLLELVLQLLSRALERSEQAMNDSTLARNITEGISSLLMTAADLNMTNHLAVEEVEETVQRGESLLQLANLTTATTVALVDDFLSPLVNNLSQNVISYRLQLLPYLEPVDCAEALSTEPCTPGQKHAYMLQIDVEEMKNDSEPTLSLAEDFLANLNRGQLFDYQELNEKALQAQNTSQEAIRKLVIANTSALLTAAENISSRTEQLQIQSLELRSVASDLLSAVNTSAERAVALQELYSNVSERAEGVRKLVDDILDFSNVSNAASEVSARAQNASAMATAALQRVERIEEGSRNVSANINQTRENVREAGLLLADTESRFESIERFLNETKIQVQQLVVDTATFIGENNDIISEIDSLIANLGDIHNNVNRINSPIRLSVPEDSSTDGERIIPYLSLQPPPGRMLDDTIQFESLDFYLRPGADYEEPAVLFYAGPVYFNNEINNATKEDYFLITAEENSIVVSWEIGESRESVSRPSTTIASSSQLFVTRVGSQFELLFGTVQLMSPVAMSQVENNSLLFRTSERTAFLLGGWPQGAQLGNPSVPIALEDYQPFQGQFQLLLFNGVQWGLWNYRSSSSMETDFIGDKEFFNNLLSSGSVWHAARSSPPVSSTLSFDGNGYLKPIQFGKATFFGGAAATITMRLVLRPNDETDALAVFLYDREEMLSMEVALKEGEVQLKIRCHNLTDTLIVDYTVPARTPAMIENQEWVINIIYLTGPANEEFKIGNDVLQTDMRGKFFRNFVQTEAWFGGVVSDMLESPFIPEVSNRSYDGCIDFYFESAAGGEEPLSGDFFRENYLNSPTQRGLSATCLTTVYAREVGLQGDGYLAYNFLDIVSKPNEAQGGGATLTSNQMVFSLSFLPQELSGVILAIIDGDEDSEVYCGMRNGLLEVGVERGDETLILRSNTIVTMAAWHYLLINVRVPTTTDGLGEFSFYLDGIVQDEQMGFQGFALQPPVSPVSDPPLYFGGIDQSLYPEINDFGNFTGCMRDFAYNFGAMAFLNPQLVMRYPPGVSYNTCPYVNASQAPSLPVRDEPPQIQVCLDAPPTELNDTHGGFHRYTRLLTGNVLGLWNSSWNVSMQLKYSSSGHVLTVSSLEGHRITLSLETSGIANLSLYQPGSQDALMSANLPVEPNIFVDAALSCSVDGSTLTCSLSLSGISSDLLSVPYDREQFAPSIPLHFGRLDGSGGELIGSFVGCIRKLEISGDSSGFGNVHTDVPCYNNSEEGIGFSGISRLSTAVKSSVSLRFKPLKDNGLILLLHKNTTQELLLAVGMFNGELRVSNFTDPDGYVAISSSSFCDPTSNIFHNLTVRFDQNNVSIVVSLENGGQEQVDLQLSASGQVLVSIGNVPVDLVVPSGSEAFHFLLSQDVNPDELPPGFAGCVRDVRVEEQPVMVETADVAERLLPGLCPTSG